MGSGTEVAPPLPPGFQLDAGSSAGSTPPPPPGFNLDSGSSSEPAKPAAAPKAAPTMADQPIMDRIMRQLGLTARAGVEGLTAPGRAVADAPAALLNAGKAALNKTAGTDFKRTPQLGDRWDSALNEILPHPESKTEKGAGFVAEAMVPTMPAVGKAASIPKPPPTQAQALASKASEAGLKLPPGEAGAGSVARTLEGWAGKIKTQQKASVENQALYNRLASEDLKLPKGVELTPKILTDMRSAYGDAYEAVKKSVSGIKFDSQFKADIAGLQGEIKAAAKEFPELLKNKEIDTLAKQLSGKSVASPRAMMELIKDLRFKGTTNLKSFDDPARRALGMAQRDAATALEDQIERGLGTGKMKDLVPEFQEARKMIAKTYDYEAALDPAGNVSAKVLGALQRRGKPLGGNAEQMAEFSKAYPKATQDPAKFGGNIPSSMFDAGAGAMLGGAGYGASEYANSGHSNESAALLGLLGLLGRPALRSALLSGPGQRMMIPRPPGP